MTIFDGTANLIASAFGSLAPFHLLFYSTLLGTELYQTFVNTKVCYIALPRSAFTTLQKRIFPIYFRGQTALLFLSAITFPPHGPLSLVQRKADWIPFAVASLTAVLNCLVYGPRTQKAMVDCVHQGNVKSSKEAFMPPYPCQRIRPQRPAMPDSLCKSTTMAPRGHRRKCSVFEGSSPGITPCPYT